MKFLLVFILLPGQFLNILWTVTVTEVTKVTSYQVPHHFGNCNGTKLLFSKVPSPSLRLVRNFEFDSISRRLGGAGTPHSNEPEPEWGKEEGGLGRDVKEGGRERERPLQVEPERERGAYRIIPLRNASEILQSHTPSNYDKCNVEMIPILREWTSFYHTNLASQIPPLGI